MRDYIAWYLVELRHRLRGVEPQQRVEDFLLETRAHLQESIDDMTSRGIAEGDAIKTAIADFGHPSLVSQAFQGKGSMNHALYWVLVGLVFLISLPIIVMMVFTATDNALGYPRVTTFDFGVTTSVVFGGVLVLALVSRRWCSLPLVGAAVIATLVAGLYVNATTNSYSLKFDSGRFVILSPAAAKEQVEVREQWLREYDTARPKFQSALAALKSGESGHLVEYIKFENNYYVVPNQAEGVHSSAYRPSKPRIPGSQSNDYSPHVRLIPLEESFSGMQSTLITSDLSEALDAWKKHGEEYLAEADEDRAGMLREMAAFATPKPPVAGELARRLFWVPLAVVGIYSLGIVALNGLVILFVDLFRSSRRKSWRKQLT